MVDPSLEVEYYAESYELMIEKIWLGWRGLEPNFYKRSFCPKNTKMAIISVWKMIERCLMAYFKHNSY